MADKSSFSPEEWKMILASPMLSGVALTLAEPSGLWDRVREHFLKKKLGLTMPDAELDEAIVEICQRMAKDRDKHRVTFYYLLAEKYGKLAALSK